MAKKGLLPPLLLLLILGWKTTTKKWVRSVTFLGNSLAPSGFLLLCQMLLLLFHCHKRQATTTIIITIKATATTTTTIRTRTSRILWAFVKWSLFFCCALSLLLVLQPDEQAARSKVGKDQKRTSSSLLFAVAALGEIGNPLKSSAKKGVS